jgi:cyclomaltodextrinase
MRTNQLRSTVALALAVVTVPAAIAGSKQELQAMSLVEPAWAASAVWYQIFPERFRNGDPSNDPTVDDIRGADPLSPPREWQIHPWGSDWYRLQPYEKANGEPGLVTHLLRRRYGGDLQGILEKLDYLQALGITALYLNPVFTAPSLHKYDGATYHHIDPNFGPDPEGDRLMIEHEDPLDPARWVWTKADLLALKLIDEVHRRGMRIIFDGVFNHMGITSFAFRDVLEKQQQSRFRDWFVVRSWEDPDLGTRFDYEGWYGVRTLPELREDDQGIVQGPREYIFAATERWMNPMGRGVSHGIDGWRLDVAYSVGHAFWKRWRQHVKTINPEAYLSAELVLPPEKAAAYLRGDEFDGEMNYNFAFACADFFFDPKPVPPSVFERRLKDLQKLYGPGPTALSQNLFGSHDANRIGSHIVNRGIGRYGNWGTYYELSKAIKNPEYDVRKPTSQEIALQKYFVIFQMTYLGAPMIYYGDEVGMWGANDPDCRKPMVWDDIDYEPETTRPDGSLRTPDSVTVNADLLAFYKKLINIRTQHPALLHGNCRTVLTDDKRGLMAFERWEGSERILVALNNSNHSQDVALKSDGTRWVDLMTGAEHGEVIHLAPQWGAILKPSGSP